MNQPPAILIVDDNPANRDTLAEVLGTDEFRIIEAADGPAALQCAQEAPPDLVLLDLMMPGMDGYEVCRHLRADARLAEVPIIMVTSLDDHASRVRGIRAGADDFIVKPFNGVELRARVRTVTRLNRYRRLHEQREQFQWAVEHAADGYVRTNHTDEIIFANARARLWLGLASKESTDAREIFLAAARRGFTCEPSSRWQDWPAERSMNNAPLLLIRPETNTARALYIEVSGRANTDGWLLRLNDVTERITARLDHRSFQAMVSHKLRTPLNAMLGGFELLSDPETLSREEVAELAGMARDGAVRLLGAVDDVLRFATLSQRSLPNPGFKIDRLEGLVRSVTTSLALSKVTVEIAGDTLRTKIGCASDTLEWILYELLENAKKFHPRGMPTVQVAAKCVGGNVCLSVTDDGATISPEQLAHAGTPFYQGEKTFTGEVPGMGLGLASVAVALWQDGGSFRVLNRNDAPGVCVELIWPGVSIAGLVRT